MPKQKIVDVLKTGKILVSDGAWGTYMHKKGLKPGECPESWNLTRPDDVYDIAKSYIDAGADMVEANSIGGTSFKLNHYGLDDKVAEINEAAAKNSRKAAGDDNWVIASVGPTGELLVTEEVTEAEMYEAYKAQAIALEKGGSDAVCIETMSDIDEAVQAIKAVKENTNMEVICTFSYEITKKGDYKSMMGVSPAQGAKACTEAGADVIGTNCGHGMDRMIEIVREMRAAVDTPILVHSNAGLPENIDGEDFFPETPEYMSERVAAIVEAGCNIIGGCCGTTPAHIAAMKEAATAINKAKGLA